MRWKRSWSTTFLGMNLVLLLCGVAHRAEGEEPNVGQETLRVITYNVQFLPEPISAKNERPQPAYRAQRIAEEMSPFDVVALQETFHNVHREQIVEHLRAAWDGQLNRVTSPQPAGFYTNGGCLILTRLPILASSSIVFKNFSRPEDYGVRADGHAAKGVIHARIARSKDDPESSIDVFVTHLEARADELRPLQHAELASFVRDTSHPQRPYLLLGDLNTKGMLTQQQDPHSQYSTMMKILREDRATVTLADVWPLLKGTANGGTTDQQSHEIGKRIDYIIVGNPAAGQPLLRPVSIDVALFPDPTITALSDHNAVMAEFAWTN